MTLRATWSDPCLPLASSCTFGSLSLCPAPYSLLICAWLLIHAVPSKMASPLTSQPSLLSIRFQHTYIHSSPLDMIYSIYCNMYIDIYLCDHLITVWWSHQTVTALRHGFYLLSILSPAPNTGAWEMKILDKDFWRDRSLFPKCGTQISNIRIAQTHWRNTNSGLPTPVAPHSCWIWNSGAGAQQSVSQHSLRWFWHKLTFKHP